MSLYAMFKSAGPSGFGYGSTSDEVTGGLDLKGKTYVLTGCNSGLGEETLRALTARGAKVFALARSEAKAQEAIDKHGGAGVPVACELSEPASVKAAVKAIRAAGDPLDGIITNAGIMALPKRTVHHGLELQILTNHVGHFILVTGLLQQLSDDGRVVVLSSGAHNNTYPEGIRLDDLDASGGYSSWAAYGQSKLANLLFSKELAKRLPKAGQRSNSLHPGVIATNLARHMPAVVNATFKTVGTALFLKTIPQGAATQLWAVTHPGAYPHNGLYFSDCNLKTPSKHGQDAELAARLWEATEGIVAKL